jgi:hypothetical protein
MAATNVKMTREGDILKIEVDLAQEHGLSKSQASITVAKSGGFIPVPGPDGEGDDDNIVLNLNCNKKKE